MKPLDQVEPHDCDDRPDPALERKGKKTGCQRLPPVCTFSASYLPTAGVNASDTSHAWNGLTAFGRPIERLAVAAVAAPELWLTARRWYSLSIHGSDSRTRELAGSWHLSRTRSLQAWRNPPSTEPVKCWRNSILLAIDRHCFLPVSGILLGAPLHLRRLSWTTNHCTPGDSVASDWGGVSAPESFGITEDVHERSAISRRIVAPLSPNSARTWPPPRAQRRQRY